MHQSGRRKSPILAAYRLFVNDLKMCQQVPNSDFSDQHCFRCRRSSATNFTTNEDLAHLLNLCIEHAFGVQFNKLQTDRSSECQHRLFRPFHDFSIKNPVITGERRKHHSLSTGMDIENDIGQWQDFILNEMSDHQ